MKICILTRRFSLASGGIGRVASEIRDRLRELGYQVKSVSIEEEDLVSYFKYTFWGIRGKIPLNYGIYHAITPMESIWLPKRKSVATILDIIPVTHPHLHGARMGGSKLKYTIGKGCFTIGCKQAARCAGVACISDHVSREFDRHFKRKPQVIRLGIRDDLEPKPKLKQDDVLRIGYLGQVDRRKRVHLLVDAFMESELDAELHIAGDGTDRLELQKKAILDGRIFFTGFLPDGEIADFYNSLDALVFPTAIEGYGLPIVEAMACLKPVIVLSDSIIPNDLKERCIVVDSLDVALSNQERLLNMVKYAHTDNNYSFAKTHSWKECVGEYVKLYERVLANEAV